ncbi:MAG TPA: T9SS type A sorting domain-containing protein [Flavipsychrobacter sp.]|nr:T9SS type A sorting domain-containing protein [Flavipsychrobacter sp.]
MKQLFTITALALSTAAYAQPVISNGNNMPPVGYSDTVSIVATGANPGSGGANVTWNFSAHTPMLVGKFTVVNPANTPYASTFPSATFGIELTPFSGSSMYEYYIISAAKWETVGGGITSSGGDDYTPNPKTMIPFPFSFNDVVTDVFTKQNGTHNLTMTYDGYGTLITPYITYNNVVRMKREFGGNDYFYEWFVTTPYLMTVATYDNNNGRLTFVGKSVINSIKDVSTASTQVTVIPNPVTSSAIIRINAASNLNGKVIVTNVMGSVVKELSVKNNEAILSREGLTAGLYFYNVVTEKGSAAKGKFVVE